MAKALPGRKQSMSGTTKLLLWMGGAVVVLGAGITTAVLLTKPASAAPAPTPPNPAPPGPPPVPVVNPTSYTFMPGRRYRVTLIYTVTLQPISVPVAQSQIAQLLGAPVVIVSATNPTPTSEAITFDYNGASAVTAPILTNALQQVTVEDLGATPSPP